MDRDQELPALKREFPTSGSGGARASGVRRAYIRNHLGRDFTVTGLWHYRSEECLQGRVSVIYAVSKVWLTRQGRSLRSEPTMLLVCVVKQFSQGCAPL